jgi:prepilin-type N-terminal cleavage/methylation domain-containing protein
MMSNLRSRPRAGFTLIELVVVIFLILILATLALLISPRAAEQSRIARGADQLSGWLLISKQRSYRDQIPRGVRLIVDNNLASPGYGKWVKELAYIERPVDIPGNTLHVPAIPPALNQPQNANNHLVFIPGPGLTPGPDLQSGDTVLAGDFLQLNSYEFAPYNVHRINAVQYPFTATLGTPPAQVVGTLLTLQAADGTKSPIAVNINGQTGTQGLYQIVRAPRVMVGEPTLAMPRDVIIDLDPTSEGSSFLPGCTNPPAMPTFVNPLNPYYDILFSERGQVIASNGLAGAGGKIILRVRNSDRPPSPLSVLPNNIVYDWGDQFLVTIYTRTGLIATHPLNLDLNPPAMQPPVLADPFKFTRDGLTSGF